jgi:hypothetical protein
VGRDGGWEALFQSARTFRITLIFFASFPVGSFICGACFRTMPFPPGSIPGRVLTLYWSSSGLRRLLRSDSLSQTR